MSRTPTPRGATLIEAMIAMAILMIGASGIAATDSQGRLMLGDAQRLTRATVVARDLVSQIETWDFGDVRLSNADSTNDGDLGDSRALFMTQDAPPADHGEADLPNGGGWNGLPTSYLEDAGMERYYNVAYLDDANANGVPDAVRGAVIVRWRGGGGWRRVVFPFVKANPADVR